MSQEYPNDLMFNDRLKLPTSSFKDEDLLYRSFSKRDIDESGEILLESIRFPDFSCNWSQFSEAEYILCRSNCSPNDGCFSFSVKTSMFNNFARPVHDPLDVDEKNFFQNYSHVEVRELKDGEDINSEPPKARKKGNKTLRLIYRRNLLNNKKIEFVTKD